MKRILFYVARDMQLSFLEPVHDILANEKGIETVFSAPEYQPSLEIGPGWGLNEEQIKRLEQKSTFVPDASKINADLAIVADNSHYRLHRIDHVVNIGHGLISKGFYYTDDPVTRKENLSRLICVPGPWHKKRLSRQVSSPIEVTGFIKSDLLCGPEPRSRADFCHEKSIPPGNRLILFAPTFNPELNCLSRIGRQIPHIAGDRTTLLVKLHNMTDYIWQEYYRDMAASNKNILLLDDADYAGMMHAADVIISDVSSIYIEFIMLDKPAIVVPNPENEKYFKYDPRDIEYRAREAAHVMDNGQDLLRTIDHALKNPGEKCPLRRKYREELDFGRDGKSALRTAQAIKDVLEDSPRLSQPGPPVSIILDGTGFGEEETARSIHELQQQNDCLPVETFLLSHTHSSFAERELLTPVLIKEKEPEKEIREIVTKCKNAHIICLKCGYFLPRGWLKHLWLNALWNGDAQVVKTMSDPQLLGKYFSQLYPGLNVEEFSIHRIQRMILIAAAGQSAQDCHIASAGLITRKGILREFHSHRPVDPQCKKGKIFAAISKYLDRQKSALALDIYLHPQDAPVSNAWEIIQKAKTLFARGEHLKAKALLGHIPAGGAPQNN